MARRSWPVAVNPVSGALTWESGSSLTATLFGQSSPNTDTGNVTWTGGATTDKWPVAVQHQTGALTYSS